jgi:uncharacterized protein YdhG (YjbR/CyaY superfamily)
LQLLHSEINVGLPKGTSKIYHAAPVWFIGENAVVGFGVTATKGVNLLFWNGQALKEPELKAVGKFKAAQIYFKDVTEINTKNLRRWLKKAAKDIWDFSTLRKRWERGQALGEVEIKKKTSKEIDSYINGFPKVVQKKLKEMRRTIRKAAPLAEEKIRYRIPTYFLNGNLVHYVAFNDHISFFPTSSGIRAFKSELSAYKTSTGTVQFQLDEPLPLALVTRIVKFRVEEEMGKHKRK